MAPSAEDIPTLLKTIHTLLPPAVPQSASYLLPASTLVALGQPNLLGPLFTHVTASRSSDEARTVSIQLRDVLLKEWTLIGIPLVITAAASLAAAEKAAGFDFPAELSARYGDDAATQSVAPDSAVSARGEAFLRFLYRHNLEGITAGWGSHEADFLWLETSVIYGLFLSDHEVLSEVETELVILSSIVAQDLKTPSLWHVRGLRRLGVSREDVESVVRIVEECARWAGKGEKGWVEWVKEIEAEV